MTISLLDICNRAMDEISSFNAPTYVIGNDDDTAKSLIAAARKVGEELVRDYDWQEMSRTATVTTEDTVSVYDLEDDYERIAPDSMWNGTDFRFMRGHTTKREWAAITNSQVDPAMTYYWRLKGNQIQLEPAANGVFTFNYEYLSRAYCTDSLGVMRADGWMADTDLPVLPADLFIHGVRYYFCKAKNLPYGDSEAEYDAVIQSRQGKNTPTQAVNMAAAVVPPGRFNYFNRLNIPDRVDS